MNNELKIIKIKMAQKTWMNISHNSFFASPRMNTALIRKLKKIWENNNTKSKF